MNIIDKLNNDIIILDGGFGTTVQTKNLSKDDFFVEGYEKEGCNDVLVLTRPDIVEEIHKDFLLSGADIIITNTFSANAISMADYDMSDLCYNINLQAARIAKQAVNSLPNSQNKYVAGSLGPTNKSTSLPSDFMNPNLRAISSDELKDAYKEQVAGLIDGGCDVIIVETIFDSLNAKSAVVACNEVFNEKDKSLPIMVSVSINQGGRLLSGQTLEAFYYSLLAPNVISIGFNCSFGVEAMEEYLKELVKFSDKFISLYPNAGMPDDKGNYNSTPEQMAKIMKMYANDGLINIAGGCCGTTYKHIKAIADELKGIKPRKLPCNDERTIFSGIFKKDLNAKSKIGTGMNVLKNQAFLDAILNEDYEQALEFGCEDVENEADLLEVCLDNKDIDAKTVIKNLVRQIAIRPDISIVPIMINSNDFNVIKNGINQAQGRHIVKYNNFNKADINYLKLFGCGIALCANDDNNYKMLIDEINFPKRDIIMLEEL